MGVGLLSPFYEQGKLRLSYSLQSGVCVSPWFWGCFDLFTSGSCPILSALLRQKGKPRWSGDISSFTWVIQGRRQLIRPDLVSAQPRSAWKSFPQEDSVLSKIRCRADFLPLQKDLRWLMPEGVGAGAREQALLISRGTTLGESSKSNRCTLGQRWPASSQGAGCCSEFWGREDVGDCGGKALWGEPWALGSHLWRMNEGGPSACSFLSFLASLPSPPPGAGGEDVVWLGWMWEGNYILLQPKSEHLRVWKTSHAVSSLNTASFCLQVSEFLPFLKPMTPTFTQSPSPGFAKLTSLKGGQLGLLHVYRTKILWYSLFTDQQLLSTPDKWWQALWVTEMDENPCARPLYTLPLSVSLPLGSG